MVKTAIQRSGREKCEHNLNHPASSPLAYGHLLNVDCVCELVSWPAGCLILLCRLPIYFLNERVFAVHVGFNIVWVLCRELALQAAVCLRGLGVDN